VRDISNPATEARIATVPEATTHDAQLALEAARAAQPAWESMPITQRAELMLRIAARIREHTQELAHMLVQEQGKTLFEAVGEIGGTAKNFEYFASLARSVSGDILPSDNADEEIWIRKFPYGVVVALTPWNYPAATFARKVAPAILAGNTVVAKPHEYTPLTTLMLMRLIEEAGLPPGVVNTVTGAGTVVGHALVSSALTDLITLTGSVRAGRQILAAAAPHITVARLELGGKAPFIVMDDADLDQAVQAAITQRFLNCGQVCTCNERTYIHRRVFDAFVEKFVERARQLRMGNPMQAGIDIGPKVSLQELEKVEAMVERARIAGAEVVLGGKRPAGSEFQKGFWYEPTVLVNVHHDMEIMREEVFGPVSPLMPFDDFEEAITMANDTEYGLSAYLFTGDFKRIMHAVHRLRFGEIFINKIGPVQLQGFHTGWGLSGQGGENGTYGLDLYSRRKAIYLNYGRMPTNNLMPYP
jgi:lactaldehyde dehydrogenase/glycolaldehyde dehydrogenase